MPNPLTVVPNPASLSLLGDQDLHLFNEGTHTRLYEKLGAHPVALGGRPGTYFAVWAPDAKAVSVAGDFNGWNPKNAPLAPRGRSGIWEGFVPGVGPGALYKYRIASRYHGLKTEKADPVGFFHEVSPRTASVVTDLAYDWGDAEWMAVRASKNRLDAPMSIYELHLGSWKKGLSYREIAPLLADHVSDLGFTHVEFLPVMEHPFYGSWGYQTTGYFAPTARYGTPQDFMALVDHLHRRGIGVILDWVPSHFPTDPHGPGFFDGTHLYEHAHPSQGFHPDWKSYVFNYKRNEVRSFLSSSACFWLERYHADALRVDAVASMLYLDYSRKDGEWIPNEHGGHENLDAIHFLRSLNEEIYRGFPGVQTIAEESTAWPMVSRPASVGGLGFGLKWDMGWMNDTLRYFAKDPVHRKFHHGDLTFRQLYAHTENFVLPLSHDEVVHGKGSLLGRMPGDDWQRFANLRLLYAWQYGQPGKKLLFMGGEFGPWSEWDHERGLDWELLQYGPHRGIRRWVTDLNRLYRSEPALHEGDCQPWGFEWIDCHDADAGVLSFLRKDRDGNAVLAVLNFTPVPRLGYGIGVPAGGVWRELLNSDGREYGGSGMGNLGRTAAAGRPRHGRPYSLSLTLPPLGALFLKKDI
ncbi:MAG TPA: 1,4-alpha-glucan branching protein GlgB [bacterium]|nr:1,4-alpha-glucan branching protein GlgB [bacterium]